nr:xylulose kinase-1 [Tanacetum cinerariifolium]
EVIQNGNRLKRTGRDRDGRVIILPPTTANEHIAIQRESKARTTLLQSIPDDHVADFHYMDDARDIWNAVKARMQKILSQLNLLKAKLEDEDINLKFLRALPSSWSQMSKDTLLFPQANLQVYAILYLLVPPVLAKRCHMEIVQVILQLLPTLLHQTLRLGLTDLIENLDLKEMDLKWQMAMLSVRVHKFEQKTRRKIDFDKKEFARFNKKKVRCYKCQQRGHFARECRAKGGNDKQRYSLFKIKEIGKKEEESKALITVYTLVDWTDHDGESDGVIASKEFGMIVGCNTKDAIEEGAAKIYNLITEADTEEASTVGDAGEFALMGVTFERISAKNLFRLIDSSMSVRTKVGLGFNNYIRENELGWDDSAFSVFTTNSEDVEGRPLFNSGTHLIKDCDFYKKQMVNKTVGIRVEPIHSRNKVNHQNQFVLQAVLIRTGKVNIPPARPQPVPTGKPKVFAPVPTGRQNRPFLVPTDRRYSPSVTSDAEDDGVFDSGCSRSMTSNKERLDDFQVFQGGKVTFGGGEGRITGKGTIRTPTLDFKNVYYVKQL